MLYFPLPNIGCIQNIPEIGFFFFFFKAQKGRLDNRFESSMSGNLCFLQFFCWAFHEETTANLVLSFVTQSCYCYIRTPKTPQSEDHKKGHELSRQ